MLSRADTSRLSSHRELRSKKQRVPSFGETLRNEYDEREKQFCDKPENGSERNIDVNNSLAVCEALIP